MEEENGEWSWIPLLGLYLEIPRTTQLQQIATDSLATDSLLDAGFPSPTTTGNSGSNESYMFTNPMFTTIRSTHYTNPK